MFQTLCRGLARRSDGRLWQAACSQSAQVASAAVRQYASSAVPAPDENSENGNAIPYTSWNSRWGRDGKPTSISDYNNRMFDLVKERKFIACYMLVEDMLADGISPNGKTYHSLIAVSERAGRLQDVLYYFREMTESGCVPEAVVYNYVIGTCAAAGETELAFAIKDEMVARGVRPNLRTFRGLLDACAHLGDVQKAQSVVVDMEEAGCTHSSDTYAALILAHKNQKLPPADIISDGEAIMEASSRGEGVPTEVFNAMLSLCLSVRAFERCEELLNDADLNTSPNYATSAHHVRLYILQRKFEKALEVLASKSAEEVPHVDIYVELMEEILTHRKSQEGLDLAENVFDEFISRGFFLNSSAINRLLPKASTNRMPSLSFAHILWDSFKQSHFLPSPEALFTYLRGIQVRDRFSVERLEEVQDLYFKLYSTDGLPQILKDEAKNHKYQRHNLPSNRPYQKPRNPEDSLRMAIQRSMVEEPESSTLSTTAAESGNTGVADVQKEDGL